MSQSTITVKHVRLTVDKPYDEFTAAFERPARASKRMSTRSSRKAETAAAAKARLESMVGPSGFMLFRTSNHGALLKIVGRPVKAMQYLVGNPLFAIEMTRHAIGAALYAPCAC